MPSPVHSPSCESTSRGRSSESSDEKKRRRRIQNRVSQRKHRSLNMENGAGDTESSKKASTRRPYAVVRWRLGEYESTPVGDDISHDGHDGNTFPSNYNTLVARDSTIAASQCQKRGYALPADNLLHLVVQNAFQGLYSNKDILARLAIAFTTSCDNSIPEFHNFHSVFPSYSVVFPAAREIPSALDPTHRQMSRAHQTWIDVLPFPTMRDNLIQWESSFDHSEFVRDVIGNFFDIRSPFVTRNSPTPAPSSNLVMVCEDGDSGYESGSGTGLILWGEPYLEDSWEATPDFLRKWTWAVEGCDGLLKSTNHWRRIRGDPPIRLIASS